MSGSIIPVGHVNWSFSPGPGDDPIDGWWISPYTDGHNYDAGGDPVCPPFRKYGSDLHPVATRDLSGINAWELHPAGNSRDCSLYEGQHFSPASATMAKTVVTRPNTLLPMWLRVTFNALPDPLSRLTENAWRIGRFTAAAGVPRIALGPQWLARDADLDFTPVVWNTGTSAPHSMALWTPNFLGATIGIRCYLRTACNTSGNYTTDATHALVECWFMTTSTENPYAGGHFYQLSITRDLGAPDARDAINTLTYQYSWGGPPSAPFLVPALAGATATITLDI